MSDTTWTPGIPLRHDATNGCLYKRRAYRLEAEMDDQETVCVSLARELAEAVAAQRVAEVQEKYQRLRDAVNASAERCVDTCDSDGHDSEGGCRTFDAASWVAGLQAQLAAVTQERDRLRLLIDTRLLTITTDPKSFGLPAYTPPTDVFAAERMLSVLRVCEGACVTASGEEASGTLSDGVLLTLRYAEEYVEALRRYALAHADTAPAVESSRALATEEG